MKILIRIPAAIVAERLAYLRRHGLDKTPPIGEVHLVGDWNNWGDSGKRAGCIIPTPESRMTLVGDQYEITLDLVAGVHRCKPVVVRTVTSQAGFASTYWYDCPLDHPFFKRTGQKQKWEFVVK